MGRLMVVRDPEGRTYAMTSTLRYRLLIGTLAALGLRFTVAFTYDVNDPAPPKPRAQRAPAPVIVDAEPQRPSRPPAKAATYPRNPRPKPPVHRPSSVRKVRDGKPVIVKAKKQNRMG